MTAKERILIVEDERVVAELLKEFLKNFGFEISAVTGDGEEAVSLAIGIRPDLVLMDIKLRGAMTGVDAARQIQESLDIPVIYLTAYSDDETLQRIKASAPFGYIQKPFKGGEIRSAIDIALYRSRMERKLKENERSYRILAENLPGIVYRFNVSGEQKLRFFNSMITDLTGYGADEIVPGESCPLDFLILPQDLPAVSSAISAAVAANKPFEVEYRIRHKDGSILHFQERGRPIFGKDGEQCQIDGVILNITESKRVVEELEAAYDKLAERTAFIESIMTNIQSGIIVTDLDLTITLANPYVAALCEVSLEEIIFCDLRKICPELSRSIEDHVTKGEMLLHFMGHELTVGFTRFNLKDGEGAVGGHIFTFKDLSEIVKIRHEMRKQERLATMGEVVARVAHEMRNPLFAITSVAQILGMEIDFTSSQKELMDALMTEARRMNHLVEDLLDCSKEIRLKMKDVNAAEIIGKCIGISNHYKVDKGVRIRNRADQAVKIVIADPDRIEQVIINLLQNAVDATPSGGTVDIQVGEEEGKVIIEISDTGQGIPENSFEKIFEVFYTTKRHGTGLGLHISKKIVDAHGGTLTARNNEDGGATFTVILPVETPGL